MQNLQPSIENIVIIGYYIILLEIKKLFLIF